ncbi:MAG TPA: hypothetical protein VGL61_27085 [Kofleriaceae bacterium]|jgi:hypothetical protein
MDWVKFYYATPHPERFVDEVRALAKGNALDDPPKRFVLATFLGRVIAANPKRVSSWFAQLADLTGPARETLHLAAWMSGTHEARECLQRAGAEAQLLGPAPDLLARDVDHPIALDMLWAHYFATGDARAVRRIVSALGLMNDYGAAAQFKSSAQTAEDKARALNDGIFQAASWSLGSLMKEHPPLLATCERIFDSPDLNPIERVSLAITLSKVAPETWDVQIDRVSGEANITRKPRVDRAGE